MTLSERDKRALLLLVVAAAVFLILNFAWQPRASAPAVVSANVNSIAAAEKRLDRLRAIAATIPGKEALLKQVAADAADGENGLLHADTAPLAQAQLLGIARRVAAALPQPIEFSSVELPQRPQKLAEDYGEVLVTVNFSCRIEDLVNFLAEITAQPEAIATRELRVQLADAKQKALTVRLTLAGAVPKNLVPQKKVGF